MVVSFNPIDLEYIVDALQSLKGTGAKREDELESQLWHNIPKPYTGEHHQDAKRALRKMKSALKTLHGVAKSLELSIQSLSRDCVALERAAGITSLPDELLARVFEIYCEDYLRTFGHEQEDSLDSPMALCRVCRRFQRIALHTPSLWACVSSDFMPERMYMLRTRCPNPVVFVKSEFETSKQEIVDFIKQLHPNSQWRGLDLEYESEDDGRLLFEGVGQETKAPFEALEQLSISYRGFLVEGDAPPKFTKECDKIFAGWNMPKLRSLTLSNIIPSNRFTLPSLKSCSISLGNLVDKITQWDFNLLQAFVGSASLAPIESLTVIFEGTQMANTKVRSREFALSKLKFLKLCVKTHTNVKALEQFMKFVDAPNLEEFSVELSWRQAGNSNMASEWLNAIFQPSEGLIRTFPNVRKFSIVTQDEGLVRLPLLPMLRGLPRLQALSMNIPNIDIPYYPAFKSRYGCLQELKTLQLTACSSSCSPGLFCFLCDVHKRGEGGWEGLQEVDLNGCGGLGLAGYRQNVQSLFADKLLWKS